MLQALFGFVSTIFGWLSNLLPDSPFANFAHVTDQMSLGLSWLNWLIPMNEMLAILAIWITACAAITAVRFALDITGILGGKVSG